MVKNDQSFPKFYFPEGFCLSTNLNHYSKTAESIKHIKEIITAYVEKERACLMFSNMQPTLLIMDVFRGQMTKHLLKCI